MIKGALSQGVKRQGREADHSSPTSAEIKKTLIYTSIGKITFYLLSSVNWNLPH
jgi:hypothetical protein